MGKRALVTGITGFVGSHLAELLLAKGVEVWGIKRWRSKTENIDHIRKKLRLVEADMRDLHSLIEAVHEARPDFIFHLASQSFVPMSWKAPADTMDTNVTGTVHLFEAVRRSGCDPTIQVAGSSEEYGLVHADEVPIKETNPFRPLSPYGISKVAEDLLAFQYHRSYGLRTITTRAFNHTGPRRGEVFVTSDFARQIALIEKGSREPVIHVGNLKAQRDFTDVRDVVAAYWLCVHKCVPGEAYNICSERSRTIQEVLDLLLSMSKRQDIKVVQDPDRMRPSDVEVLRGDCSKFRAATGWKPKIPFKRTMGDLLEYWRMKSDIRTCD